MEDERQHKQLKLKPLCHELPKPKIPMRNLLSLILVLVTATASMAEDRAKFPIEVINKSTDAVGGRLAFRIKEKLGQSSIFRLADGEAKCIQLIITTMERDASTPNASTIYSINWTFPKNKQAPLPLLIDSTMGYCGASRIDESADSILASTDNMIDRILGKMRHAFSQ